MSFKQFYNELNDQQRLAVDTQDGPILVLAGPGTGKTQLLSVRAASILKNKKVRPENILILTYTNAAAKAMKERLAKVAGRAGYDVEVGTFHSFANSIIQESEEAASYAGDKIQMTDVERVRVVEHVLDNAKGLEDIRPFNAPYTYLKELLEKISELKKDGIAPDDLESYLKSKDKAILYLDEKHLRRLRALAIVYRMYEELKEPSVTSIFDERGRYDFDDMILFATEALRNEPSLREEYQSRYTYVMVDEYQDTNGAQLDLLFTLLDYENPNLLCVGDDDQSIYRFQGASVGNFKLLKERFPAIKILSLKDNYRSTAELIDASRKIISLIPPEERMGEKRLNQLKDYRDKEIEFREFTTEEEEIVYIIDKTKSLKTRIEKDAALSSEERKHPYNNIAVLVRKRKDILKIIDAFLRAGIPYATDGKEDIAGEKRARQLLDILMLAHIDPKEREEKDLALYKVLTADYFDIPHIDILRFINYIDKKRKEEDAFDTYLLVEFFEYFLSEKKKDSITFENENKLRKAAQTIKKLLDDARVRTVHSILIDFIKEAGIFRYILKEFADNEILRIRELRALSSFVNMVKSSDMATPGIGLDDFMLEMKTRKSHGLPIQGDLVSMTQDGVRIFTAHGSKGHEFQVVFIPFCLQNKNWPSRPIPEKIPLPVDLFKTKERVREKEMLRQLTMQDETRLFYVAMTRAKSNLIFTASPTEDCISSFYLSSLGVKMEAPEYIASEEDVIQKSLELTDLTDPFIGTEEVLKDMVATLSLNPTRLNNYLSCRRKFLYNDVLRIPGSKKKSLVFGNCVHKALEETYKTFQKEKKFPAFQFFQKAFERELKYQGVDKVMKSDCLNKMRGTDIRNWFELASKNAIVPISLEKKLIVTIGDNIIFTGKYDKVEWEDEKRKTVRILDYKTGKPDKHLASLDKCDDMTSDDCDGYLRQLVCYRLLFEKDKRESRGRTVGSGELVFIEPVSKDMRGLGYKKGQYVNKRIDISDDMVSEMEKIVKDSWNNIKNLQFQKLHERDKDKCGRCDFDNICWG